MSGEGTYTVAPAGHDTYQLVRIYRPTWAIALGVLGIAFFGLGILFFLLRKTEVCTLKVVDGPTGAVLTITGAILPTTLAALRQALEASPATSPSAAQGALITPAHGSPVDGIAAPPTAVPGGAALAAGRTTLPMALVGGLTATGISPADEQDFEHTVHRASSRSAQGGTRYWMRLPEGRVVPLVGTTLLGRDPAPLPGEVTPTLVPLADPTMQVSKTHLALRVLDGALQAQDLHSTNGTVINDRSGWRVVLSGGEFAPVKPGAFLELGGVRIEVGVGG